MSRFVFGHRWMVVSFVLIASLSTGTASGLAQTAMVDGDCSAIQFEVANPAPGSRIDPGTFVLQGVAVDTRAEEGAGIDRIEFFLGPRDDGGLVLGHTYPGAAGMTEPFGPNSFSATITVPNMMGGREIFGYAHSAVTNQESIIDLPIAVGTDPSKPGVLTSTSPTMMCTQVAVPAQPEPTFAPPAEVPMVDMAPPEEGSEMPAMDNGTARMFFEIGNPSPGDSIHVGGLLIEGMAFDRAADAGPGIGHIAVFLDNRDEGGVLLGHGQMGARSPVPDDPELSGAAWMAQLMIPTTAKGQHTLFFYALSDATGGEMVVQIPVLVVP